MDYDKLVQRAESFPEFIFEQGEKLIGDYIISCKQEMKLINGRIKLTNFRLIFIPMSVDLFAPLEIRKNQIKQIEQINQSTIQISINDGNNIIFTTSWIDVIVHLYNNLDSNFINI